MQSKSVQKRLDVQQEITDWRGRPFPREEVLSHVGEGWHPIVESLIEDLFKLGWNGQLAQIKEKFGGLRFYINGGSEEIFDRINKAEDESFKTCERCGLPGKGGYWGYGYWITTLCEECGKKRAQEVEAEKAKLNVPRS